MDLLRYVADLPDSAVEDFGVAARQHVSREFSPGRYLDGVNTIYSELGVTCR
jgi:hypothetical protein